MLINENEFKSQLSRVFKLCGVSSLLSAEKSDKFYKLTERLLEENEKYNLTAITDVNKIILNHYADCAVPLAKIKKGAKVIRSIVGETAVIEEGAVIGGKAGKITLVGPEAVVPANAVVEIGAIFGKEGAK